MRFTNFKTTQKCCQCYLLFASHTWIASEQMHVQKWIICKHSNDSWGEFVLQVFRQIQVFVTKRNAFNRSELVKTYMKLGCSRSSSSHSVYILRAGLTGQWHIYMRRGHDLTSPKCAFAKSDLKKHDGKSRGKEAKRLAGQILRVAFSTVR